MRLTVRRTVEFKTDYFCVGDQLFIKLKGIGEFTATAHKITDNGVLFIFDECVACMPMNFGNTKNGGFEASDLKKWMDMVLLNAFPEKLRKRITQLTLPTCGEIFGRCDDNDEQLPLMKNRKNRICAFNGDFSWWWLRNVTKQERSLAYFASVYNVGREGYCYALDSIGVRPEFWLAL